MHYISKKKINVFFLSVFLFFFIYMPPLTSIHTIHIISPVVWIILLLRYRKNTNQLLKNKRVFLFILGILCSIISLTVTLLFTTKDFNYLKGVVFILLEVVPCVLLITILFEKNKLDLNDIFQILLNLALIQGLISITTFINPTIREWILNQFYYEQYVIGKYANLTANRIYGFTDGFTYAMPVVQSFMAIVAFIYATEKSLKYSLYIPPLLFSSAINARTGLLIFVAGMLFVIFIKMFRSNAKKTSRLFVIILIFILSIPVLLNFIESKSEITANWIKDSYYETKSFIGGEEKGYYSAVSKMVVFPETKGLMMGVGEDRFGKPTMSSDVGYVNDLFLGGIVFVILLYSSFLSLFLVPIKDIRREYKILPLLIVFFMLILNIKGYAFKFSNFNNLFILIIFVLIRYSYRDKQIQIKKCYIRKVDI